MNNENDATVLKLMNNVLLSAPDGEFQIGQILAIIGTLEELRYVPEIRRVMLEKDYLLDNMLTTYLTPTGKAARDAGGHFKYERKERRAAGLEKFKNLKDYFWWLPIVISLGAIWLSARTKETDNLQMKLNNINQELKTRQDTFDARQKAFELKIKNQEKRYKQLLKK